MALFAIRYSLLATCLTRLRVFVGARLAVELRALEEAALGGIELAQERHDVGRRHRRGPADLAADLVADLAQHPRRIRRIRMTQQFLEHLQLEGAVGSQL